MVLAGSNVLDSLALTLAPRVRVEEDCSRSSEVIGNGLVIGGRRSGRCVGRRSYQVSLAWLRLWLWWQGVLSETAAADKSYYTGSQACYDTKAENGGNDDPSLIQPGTRALGIRILQFLFHAEQSYQLGIQTQNGFEATFCTETLGDNQQQLGVSQADTALSTRCMTAINLIIDNTMHSQTNKSSHIITKACDDFKLMNMNIYCMM